MLALTVLIFWFFLPLAMTPGPNNIMLAASGVNFGYRRTLPHIFGVIIGFFLMISLVGLGVGELIAHYSIIEKTLKVFGTLFMLWLAWKIATAGETREGRSRTQPMTLLQALAFQWINPKSWAAIASALGLFWHKAQTMEGVDSAQQVVIAMGLASLIPSIISTNLWALLGTAIKRFLKNPLYLRIFNIMMALLLVLSITSVWLPG